MTTAQVKAGLIVFVTSVGGGRLEYVNVFTQPGGQSGGGEYVGSVNEGDDVGTLTGQTRLAGGEEWAEVVLANTFTKAGRTFSTGWVGLAPVSLRSVQFDYYAQNATGGDVNRRTSPEYKPGNVLLPAVKNGALAGRGYGLEKNGYVKILGKGQTFWMSKNYVRAVPVAVPEQPTPGSKPTTLPDIIRVTTANVSSTPGLLQGLKWITIGLGAILLGAVLAAFTEKRLER